MLCACGDAVCSTADSKQAGVKTGSTEQEVVTLGVTTKNAIAQDACMLRPY